ncbi:hypothetical protein [Ralstonia sp. ASV6]|uniref:hypothetical protein n=1 Tax=Ralstonia sp. ASV6 TaxID=2795124 RepID=UPI0018EBA140|nr:hypothetical protein [Ralstonia sp. ASV6]
MNRLQSAIILYITAKSKGDLLIAKAGLIRIGISLQNMEGFFSVLTHDIKKTYLDPRFTFPEFPSENWKIPPEYNFK